MAYDREGILDNVIAAIKENKLKHFSYIEAYVEPCTKTLYEMFPDKSDESHTIKRELGLNKITSKVKLRNNWEESENPTLQIAAFKLMAEEDELNRLTSSKYEVDNRNVNLNAELTEEEKKVELDNIKKGLSELNDY